MTPLWPMLGAPRVHQDFEASRCLASCTRHPTGNLFRRFFNNGRISLPFNVTFELCSLYLEWNICQNKHFREYFIK